jgi:hypothetical protein
MCYLFTSDHIFKKYCLLCTIISFCLISWEHYNFKFVSLPFFSLSGFSIVYMLDLSSHSICYFSNFSIFFIFFAFFLYIFWLTSLPVFCLSLGGNIHWVLKFCSVLIVVVWWYWSLNWRPCAYPGKQTTTWVTPPAKSRCGQC